MADTADGIQVVWDSEIDCFSTFLRELALFYVPESLPPKKEESTKPGVEDTATEAPEKPDDGDVQMAEADKQEEEDEREIEARRAELHQCLEDVMFPAFRKRLIATTELLPAVTEIANLKGLYRVFERSC